MIFTVFKRAPTVVYRFKAGFRLDPFRMASSKAHLPWASVFSTDENDRVEIKFAHTNVENGKERVYNMSRSKEEALHLTLARLAANVDKVVNKPKKKRKAPKYAEEQGLHPDVCDLKPAVKTAILSNGVEINSEDVLNIYAWKTGNVLQVQAAQYQIQVNPPVVNSITIPDIVMHSYPIYCKFEASFHDRCEFAWYRKNAGSKPDELNWEEVSHDVKYCPSQADVGCNVKLKVTPIREDLRGLSVESDPQVVTQGPMLKAITKRHELTANASNPASFRLVSYNILADLYADQSDYSRDHLFGHCPPEKLAYGYRKQLLLKEIQGYNADIICLQEVDSKFFHYPMADVFECQGFEGLLSLKPDPVAEGCAVFYRKEKFRKLSCHDINMMETLRTDERYQDILEKVNSNESFAELCHERRTTVQVVTLESVENTQNKVLVATSHFFWHPAAANVRIIQAIIALRHIEQIVDSHKQKGENLAVVFCGDLNSDPRYGTVELIVNGSIPASHADWYCGGKAKFLADMNLSHSLKLSSAMEFPKYTNYVGGFRGCLDYIFIDKEKLQVESVVPLPSHEDIVEYTALPNEEIPSDHLALVCDIKWKM